MIEVSEKRFDEQEQEQVTLLRDALDIAYDHLLVHWTETQIKTVAPLNKIHEALAATDQGSTNQDKSALFKSLGLVPWDNKPPACTDTVWIEPGKVAAPEINHHDEE